MKLRDIIFWCHLCVGVAVGAVILVMAVTGTMLAFRPQILDAAEGHLRKVTPPANSAKLSLATIVGKAVETNSKDKLTGINLQSSPEASVAVNFGPDKMLYVDPYTGHVLGQGSAANTFLAKVEIWHRWLGMQGKLKPVGHNIKCACNAVFFIMILSGIYLWWPQSWDLKGIKNIIFFNPQASGKARDWNWHNVIGIWCAPFLLVISLTGLIMSYAWANDLFFRAVGSEPPAAKKAESGVSDRSQSGTQPLDLDMILARTQEKVPSWVSMNIRLPQKAGAPVMVYVQEQGARMYQRSQLTLNSATSEITKWEPFAEQSSGRKAKAWIKPIHTGEAGGIVGQSISFLAAAGAVMLVWTGFAMAGRRFFSLKTNKI